MALKWLYINTGSVALPNIDFKSVLLDKTNVSYELYCVGLYF